MVEQNIHPRNIEKLLLIPTSIPLWEFLMKNVRKSPRMSRPEAFLDLIDRQKIALIVDHDRFIHGGISDFSRSWGWDRETVVRFLDQLKELGVITSETIGNRKAFRLHYTLTAESDPGIT